MKEWFLSWLIALLFGRRSADETAKAAERLQAVVEELQEEIRRGSA